MKLNTAATITVPRPIEAVYDHATNAAAHSKFLLPAGIIPGVTGVEDLGSSRRRVSLSDGSTIDEEVTVLDRPRRCVYHWVTKPKAPFGWLIETGEAEWTFEASGSGTEVRWRYAFTLTSPLAAPLALPIIPLFRRWMQKGLERLGPTMS
jgi:uncharacterized protein YndB with AHSA1/START domain